MVTLAPLNTAPEGSVTEPTMLPEPTVLCPNMPRLSTRIIPVARPNRDASLRLCLFENIRFSVLSEICDSTRQPTPTARLKVLHPGVARNSAPQLWKQLWIDQTTPRAVLR